MNKRVSRLAANIPFLRATLSPLSFTDLPRDLYNQAVLGVYELRRVELLRDLFLWAYRRSAERYAAIQQSLGDPDPFRLKHRQARRQLVVEVRGRAAGPKASLPVCSACSALTSPPSSWILDPRSGHAVTGHDALRPMDASIGDGSPMMSFSKWLPLACLALTMGGCCNAIETPRNTCTCDAVYVADGQPGTYSQTDCNLNAETARQNCERDGSEFQNCTNCTCAPHASSPVCRSSCTTHAEPDDCRDP